MTVRTLSIATVSVAALGVCAANAQDSGYVDECLELIAFVQDDAAYDIDDPELASILDRNEAASCTQRLALLERGTSEVQRAASQTEDDVTTASRSVQEEVQLRETVTVQGDVDVVAPIPSIQVRPEPADVQVRSEPPRVSVREGQPEIIVREKSATITVGMPTITVEQQAPDIIITMPPSDVNVAMTEPQVEVRQAPPRITVAVPEPTVDLDLRAVPGEADTPVRTSVTRQRTAAQAEEGLQIVSRGDEGADANVYVAEAEPRVTMTGTDAEPEIDLQRPEPQVRFEGADPTIQTTGEPEVRFERVGEPNIEIRQAAADQPQSVASAGGQSAPQAVAGSAANVTVGSIVGQTVIGADDEEVGAVDRVIEMDGQTYAVVEHGGFLGIQDTDIPIPVTDLRMGDGNLYVGTLTAQRAEQMQANDISQGEELPGATTLRVRSR